MTVVTTTPPATAGSTPKRFSASGTMTPASAAASRLITIAAKITPAMRQSRYQSIATIATTVAHAIPFSTATEISLAISQRAFARST